ncbi:MAG: hypothetical protein RIC30_15235 [Marinoscillum sp.]
MILETTYNKRETIQQINQLVGKPYTLIQRLRMGGIGSKRMGISKISPEFAHYLKAGHYVTHANIELRPEGILIHFRFKLESYAWPMPYTGLEVATDPELTFTADGKFIAFKEGMKVNGPFIERMIRHMAAKKQ